MEKKVNIEGMSCEHCAKRVENALNSIDGVSAKVNLSKNQAIITATKEISNEIIEETIDDLGYTVTGIQ